jgi:hypothetical protein
VTLALISGVPLEIVQKVTGHRTAAIVNPPARMRPTSLSFPSKCRSGPPNLTSSKSSSGTPPAGRYREPKIVALAYSLDLRRKYSSRLRISPKSLAVFNGDPSDLRRL